MNKVIGVLLLAISLCSCSGLGTSSDSAIVPQQTSSRVHSDNYVQISGLVLELNQGKDGYTAKIKAVNGDIYFATLSIPNMGPDKFKQYQVGDHIVIAGQFWLLGEDKRITVRETF